MTVSLYVVYSELNQLYQIYFLRNIRFNFIRFVFLHFGPGIPKIKFSRIHYQDPLYFKHYFELIITERGSDMSVFLPLGKLMSRICLQHTFIVNKFKLNTLIHFDM